MKEAIRTITNNFDLTGEETSECRILERKMLEDGRVIDRTNRIGVVKWVQVLRV
jgi:hypothetical protein